MISNIWKIYGGKWSLKIGIGIGFVFGDEYKLEFCLEWKVKIVFSVLFEFLRLHFGVLWLDLFSVVLTPENVKYFYGWPNYTSNVVSQLESRDGEMYADWISHIF